MKRLILAAMHTAALTIAPLPSAAQTADVRVLAEFEGLAESVVRIRTIADLEVQERDLSTGETAIRPYSIDGTGVVVGEVFVDGRTEYLILTNHHVADASNYVLEEGGYLRVNPTNTLAVPSVHEASYLMKEATDSVTEADIELIELVRRVRGDMTLMRTSGVTRKLTVYEGPIGYREGEVTPGSLIVTSGYPWGGAKILATGSVTETGFLHELGLPHDDFVVDLPVEPGQSGGPIFLVEGDPAGDDPLRFRLVGLVHAKDRDRNYAVPYSLWADSLDEFPAELQERLIR